MTRLTVSMTLNAFLNMTDLISYSQNPVIPVLTDEESHSARKWESWDLKPNLSDPKALTNNFIKLTISFFYLRLDIGFSSTG